MPLPPCDSCHEHEPVKMVADLTAGGQVSLCQECWIGLCGIEIQQAGFIIEVPEPDPEPEPKPRSRKRGAKSDRPETATDAPDGRPDDGIPGGTAEPTPDPVGSANGSEPDDGADVATEPSGSPAEAGTR